MSRLTQAVTFEKLIGMTESFRQSAGGRRVARLFIPQSRGAMAALAALALTFSGCASPTANARGPAAAAFPAQVTLSDEQLRQLQLSSEVLLSQSADITDEARRNAAALLIDLGAAESRDVLKKALASTHVPTLRAVLTALAARPADPELLGAIVEALKTAPPELCDVVAGALVAQGDAALQRVAAMAADQQAAVDDRKHAIQALGSFRSREGLLKLMGLLDPKRNEPRDIIVATCSALQSLTGMRLDSNPQDWREWWSEFREKPFADVLRISLQRLSDRVQALEQQNAQLSELYADSLREVYLLLPKDEQLHRLASDLDHEMPQVRRLALDRVDRLLRDQERLPDDVKQQLVKRLGDAEPAHRRMAARLLDESNYDGLRELLATALAEERDPATAQEFLRVLIKRPTASAAAPAVQWLKDSVAGANAAALLAQLAGSGLLPEPIAEQAREIVRAAMTPPTDPNAPAAALSPAQARLLVVIGKERDLVLLEGMLDGGPIELRSAIADGFTIIGRAAPLVARAQDPVMYPFALRATANGKSDLESLQKVIALTPPEQHRAAWATEVRNIASRLPLELVITADDVIAGLPGIDARARLQLLQRAIERPAGELPAALRRAVMLRAAELALAVDEPTRALELLDQLGPQRTDQEAQALGLRAAVLAGQFDRAQQIDDDPRRWIELLRGLVELDDSAAIALQSEIEDRFLAQMDDATRAEFEAAKNLVRDAFPITEAPEPETAANASSPGGAIAEP